MPVTLWPLPPEHRSEVNCTAPANAKPGSQFYTYFVVSAEVRPHACMLVVGLRPINNRLVHPPPLMFPYSSPAATCRWSLLPARLPASGIRLPAHLPACLLQGPACPPACLLN